MPRMKIVIWFFIMLMTFQKAFNQSENTLLWKISGNNLQQPSYLFGTIHLVCPEYFIWTDKMQNALNQTNQLCLELPMADADFAAQMVNVLKFSGDSTLKTYFSDKDYMVLDSLRLPLEEFATFKPLALYGYILSQTVGCNAMSYEKKLIALDSARGVYKVIGLETLQEQINYFDHLPKDTMANMIIKSAENFEQNKKDYAEIELNYSKQRLDELYKKIDESKILQSDLIDNRNEKWIAKIKNIISETPTFIAVGAGHLPGKNGVINLLRNEGYLIEPVL